MAVSIALTALLLASGARACLLPPEGCKKLVCDSYSGFKIPSNSGDFTKVSMWVGQLNLLAFVRSSFNKNIKNIGPGSFSPAEWLAMKTNGWGAITQGPPVLPSLNYEFYNLATSTYTVPSGTVGGYNPHASLASCCNACRLSPTCPEYFYDPIAAPGFNDNKGGTCYFITSAPDPKDGPYDWVDGDDPKSARVVNIGSPAVLSRAQSGEQLKGNKYPGYVQGFLGGYCNNHKFPNGTVTDDPHFTGAHGTRFDFNGELNRAFCLLTDKSLHLNAVLKGYKSDNTVGATVGKDGKAVRSWIREVGLMWSDADGQSHSLHLVARNGKAQARGAGFLQRAEVDGEPIDIPQETGASFSAGDLTFTFMGTTKKGWYDLDQFQVVVGDQLDMSFHMRVAHPKLQSPEDAEVHFNLMFNDVKVSEKVHGVLGQTYRNTPAQLMKAVKYSELSKLLGAPVKADGESGAGFLEGQVTDYEATSVLKPDCKVSSFST